MERKVILELTKEQADALDVYLLMTTNYRKDEYEACESLAKERNEDGTLKFPNMPNNANFWKKQNETIEKIQEILQKGRIGG